MCPMTADVRLGIRIVAVARAVEPESRSIEFRYGVTAKSVRASLSALNISRGCVIF